MSLLGRPSQVRAAILALLLGILCIGKALLPGRGLLPQDVRALSPFREALAQDTRDRLDAEGVPHGKDKLLQFLPFDQAVAESWRRGRVPLWSPDILCGLPLAAQATSRPFYPTQIFHVLFPSETAYAWVWLLHLVLAGLFMYRLAKLFGAYEEGALLAELSFVLSGYVIGHVHHPMIFFSLIWCLPALEATYRLLEPG